MTILRKQIPLWALIVSVIAVASVAAAIVANWQLNLTMEIAAKMEIRIYDTDGVTELHSIDFGTLHRDSVYNFPSDAPGSYYFVKNTGEAKFWVSWNSTELTGDPPEINGVTIKTRCKAPEATDWEVMSEDEIYPTSISPSSRIYLYYEVSVSSTASFTSHSFTINWNAHDAAG